jgi:penicillin-binding protein-related factor A (putative recombinase)
MASGGMRIGVIHELQIGHLTKIEKYGLYKILVYARSKKNRLYIL